MTVRAQAMESSIRTRRIELVTLGITILRYSLAGILLYFGLFKFTPTEARAIQPLLEQFLLGAAVVTAGEALRGR
jgi:uncharacterized membrane protein YkgB